MKKLVISLILTLCIVFSFMTLNKVEASDETSSKKYEIIKINDDSFNMDVVYDKGDSRDNTAKLDTIDNEEGASFYTEDFDGEVEGDIENGYLPDDHIIESINSSTPGLKWELASYNAKNAIQLSNADTEGVSIKFEKLGVYKKLYFLTVTGGVSEGTAKMEVKVTYSDDSSDEEEFTVYDWYDSDPDGTIAYENCKRIYAYIIDDEEFELEVEGEEDGAPFMNQCEMSIDPSKIIKSVVVKNTGDDAEVIVNILAVSGELAGIDAPNISLAGNTISWNPVNGAESYTLDIGDDENFQTMDTTYNNENIGNVTSFDVSNYPSKYVRIRAVANEGSSASSNVIQIPANMQKHDTSDSGNEGNYIIVSNNDTSDSDDKQEVEDKTKEDKTTEEDTKEDTKEDNTNEEQPTGDLNEERNDYILQNAPYTKFSRLQPVAKGNTKHSVTLNWKEEAKADGYMIYGNTCNHDGEEYQLEYISTVDKDSLTFKVKGLKKGTYFKFRIVAFRMIDGKRVPIAKTPIIHTVTKGGDYGVAKAVRINKIGKKSYNTEKEVDITLKKGKTITFTAKEIKEDKTIKHHRKLVAVSDNRKVATVNKAGEICAKGKGVCTIYIYAQNGIYNTIKVKVK